MKPGSTIILKAVVVLLGLLVLILCLFAVPAGIISDTAHDYRPILFGLYLPALPFFFALYQALKLLDYIDKKNAFSTLSVVALKNIKHSAIAICALFAVGMPYVLHVANKDDAPGVALVGFVIIGASFVIFAFADLLQKLIQNAVDIKAENDLTV